MFSTARRRKEGNLCFTCGLAFTLGHRCSEKSLRVVMLVEDKEITEEGGIRKIEAGSEIEGESVEEDKGDLNCLELSQCSETNSKSE